MGKRKRRDVDIFNMSFLDVVSCGFGAIILLLVIVKISEPHVIERLAVDLTGLVQKLEAELFEIRGETTVLNRELLSKQQQLSEAREKLARLQGDMSSVRGQYQSARNEQDAQSIIAGQLSSAKQSLSEEMRRLLGADYQRSNRARRLVVCRLTASTLFSLLIPPGPCASMPGRWCSERSGRCWISIRGLKVSRS